MYVEILEGEKKQRKLGNLGKELHNLGKRLVQKFGVPKAREMEIAL